MRCGGKRVPNCVKWLEVFHFELWEKRGKIKQRRTTRTQYAALVSGNKLGTIETISVCIYSGQGDIKAVVCLALCQSHTSMLSRIIAKERASNLVSLQEKLGVSAFSRKQQCSSDIFIFFVWFSEFVKNFITNLRTVILTSVVAK